MIAPEIVESHSPIRRRGNSMTRGHQFSGLRSHASMARLGSEDRLRRAARIQGKDGCQLHPWRVVHHHPGFGLSYPTVTAADGGGAADPALALCKLYLSRGTSLDSPSLGYDSFDQHDRSGRVCDPTDDI